MLQGVGPSVKSNPKPKGGDRKSQNAKIKLAPVGQIDPCHDGRHVRQAKPKTGRNMARINSADGGGIDLTPKLAPPWARVLSRPAAQGEGKNAVRSRGRIAFPTFLPRYGGG
jgi:hypothetical protein